MDKALVELVKISRAVGGDKSLVLGEFGNTSVKTKDGRYMYVKASGTALKNMTDRIGWRKLKLKSVKAILKNKQLAAMGTYKKEAGTANLLLSACDDNIKGDVKPSVESCFHSILGRCIIHLHPAAVLAYLCAKKGKAELDILFKDKMFPPAWIPYANPGYMLAKKIEAVVHKYKKLHGRLPRILFLQNHGLVVTADNINTAIKLVRETVSICKSGLKWPRKTEIPKIDRRKIAEAISGIRNVLSGTMGRDVTVKHFNDATIAVFMAQKNTAKTCSAPAVTPDELVYANGPAVWLNVRNKQSLFDKLNRQAAARQELPRGFLIKPLGLFIAAGSSKKMCFTRDVICTYLSVRSFAAGLGGIHPLSDKHREFIIRQKCGKFNV